MQVSRPWDTPYNTTLNSHSYRPAERSRKPCNHASMAKYMHLNTPRKAVSIVIAIVVYNIR